MVKLVELKKLPKESNRDYALRVIKESIINLTLKPGTMISEQELATELKLSRTPVHEAMQELSTTKIIQVLPQKGNIVSLIDMNLVDEAIFMRLTIESALTEIACLQATDKDIQELEEHVDLQEFYLSKNNIEKLMEHDNAFHKMMYKITNRMECYYLVKMMNIHLDRIRELHLLTSDPTRVVEEHRNILEHFKKRNPEGLKELVASHLNKVYADEGKIRARYPEYFVKNEK